MKIYLVYLVINSPLNNIYSYGLGYISAYLKQHGYNTSIFALQDEDGVNQLMEDINENQPDVIGFSITTPQFGYLKIIVEHIRTFSESFIVCGGVHPTFSPRQVLDVPGVNCVIRGEGEYAMKDLMDALRNDTDYRSIKNCCFKVDGAYIENPIRPLIEDLDELPFPDKDTMEARDRDFSTNGMRFIFSRGCPFECTYCSNKALSQLYPNSNKYTRFRSVEKSIEEIKLALERAPIGFITFDDDLFSLNKKWYYSFLNEYKRNFNIPFRCNIRVGTVNEDMIKLLKEAGGNFVGIGIEHGNEQFRQNVLKRKMTNRQIIETFKWLDKYGIKHFDFMMVGMPHENRKLFLDTVRLCRKVKAGGDPSIFYPYQYTELGEECYKNGWIPYKEFYFERQEATINFPGFSKEDIQLCKRVFPHLMRHRWIPLNTPLEIIEPISNIITSIRTIKTFYRNKWLGDNN
jgi:anaerobic magnesium-protoporphyrin IX monomethyl ester cyclase